MFEALALLEKWANVVTQILGVFIAYCAYKVVMLEDDEDEDFAANPLVVFLSNLFPVTTESDERGSFLIDGKGTASLIALFTLVVFDSLFAVDSVSAKTAMISNTFLNFSSSGFAMVMLRASYFLLECAVDMFKYLKYGVGLILFLIAFVAIFPDLLPIENWQYCLVLLSIIIINMAASLILDPPNNGTEDTRNEEAASSSNASSRLSWMSKESVRDRKALLQAREDT